MQYCHIIRDHTHDQHALAKLKQVRNYARVSINASVMCFSFKYLDNLNNWLMVFSSNGGEITAFLIVVPVMDLFGKIDIEFCALNGVAEVINVLRLRIQVLR